jgi:hypothetical protein
VKFCPYCKGTGRADVDLLCLECDGTGLDQEDTGEDSDSDFYHDGDRITSPGNKDIPGRESGSEDVHRSKVVYLRRGGERRKDSGRHDQPLHRQNFAGVRLPVALSVIITMPGGYVLQMHRISEGEVKVTLFQHNAVISERIETRESLALGMGLILKA